MKPGYRAKTVWGGVAAGALALLVIWSYRQAPQNGFHFDDIPNIVDHEPVHMSELSLAGLSRAARQGFMTSRPLANLTFAFDWWRSGGRPGVFQLTNIAIHLLAALAVFGFLFAVLRIAGHKDRALLGGAFFGAALWAVHPIQSQAVTYIVQRMASLAGLFVVVSVLCYLLGRRGGGWKPLWLALAVLSAALGSLVKEIAWITPFLWMLAEFGVVRHGEQLFRTRRDWAWLILPATALAYLVVDLIAGLGLWLGFARTYDFREFTMAERLLTQPRVVAFHLSQVVWPLPERFSLLHEFPVSTSLLVPATTLPAIAATAAWIGIGVWLLPSRSRRVFGFFVLWLPTTLVIESSFVPLRMIFEHRMYLPSVGLAGLAALGAAHGLTGRSRALRSATWVAAALAVTLLAVATSARIPVWKDDLSLWTDVTGKYPCSADGQNNLGEVHWRQGRLQKAMEHYQAAVRCDPDYPQALINLARSYRQLSQTDKALEHYRQVLVIAPDWATPHFSLGMLFLETGDFERARIEFLRTLELDPQHPQAAMFLRYVAQQSLTRTN